MTPKLSRKLKPGMALAVRTCTAEMTSHGGFTWPTKGTVTAPDWKPTAKCGNGLHGLLWGEGNGTLLDWSEDARWLVVEVDPAECVEICGKVKFPSAEVLYVGGREAACGLIADHPGAAGKATVGAIRTAGYRGTATAGYGGTATAGYGGIATAGYRGTATAGYGGTLVIRHWSTSRQRYTIKTAEVGEDGIEPDIAYQLDADGRFVKVAS